MSPLRLAVVMVIAVLAAACIGQRSVVPDEPLSVLALGDSYTAGTLVADDETWPAQLAARLGEDGRRVAVEVVAREGWTSRRLALELEQHPPIGRFDAVVLSIGVNDHFNGFGEESFATGLDDLSGVLPTLVADDGSLVIVAIPDWGASPWAEARGRAADGLDAYNALLAERAAELEAAFVDMNDIVRDAPDAAYATDGLHPGPEIYTAWAGRLAPLITPDR